MDKGSTDNNTIQKLSPWTYRGVEFTSELIGKNVGFVYMIVNTINSTYYIGKKTFFQTRRTKVKGKKKRKVVTKESDWKTYTSSSEIVNAEIEKHGKQHFYRKILSLHQSKRSLNYSEVREQFAYKVLEDPLSLNANILGKYFKEKQE